MPISTTIDDRYGISDVCLSFPAVIGKKGVKDILDLDLSDDELKKFRDSATAIKKIIDAIPK